ncbi:MAG: hypothetical protein WCO60_18720 [Verrucomicrobiota bacterium]
MISISNPDDDHNNLHPKTPKQEFEDLVRSLKPQLNKIPKELRIPPVPPCEQALSEVDDYIKNVMKLPVEGSIPSHILVGNEVVERAKIREGRIGVTNQAHVFAFLYPFGKLAQTVLIYPRDGIDPRMIAKAVFWGRVSEIPRELAQSEIVPVQQFFSIKCLKLSELLDSPLLSAAKSKIRAAANAEIEQLRVRLMRAEESLKEVGANKISLSPESVSPVPEELTELNSKYLKEQHRAEHWKLLGMIALAISVSETMLFLAGKR